MRAAGPSLVILIGLAAVLRPHPLAELLSLVRRDLSVAIHIGSIEVPERGGLSFLQRHSTVLIGVCHLEHMAAEIVHAAAVELAAVASAVAVAIARCEALLALRCLGIPLRTADRTVAVAVDPLGSLLAPVLAVFGELERSAVRAASASALVTAPSRFVSTFAKCSATFA